MKIVKIMALSLLILSSVALGKETTSKKINALEEAISSGDLRAAKKIVKGGVDVNQTFGTIKETPLTLAALNGRAAIVELLIKHNADLNAKTTNGMTALFFASYGKIEGALRPSFDQPDYTKVVETLVSNGADVTIKDDEGETALDVAKKNNRSVKILKMLTPQ
jgi:ankyrin repeat protein